MFSFHFVNYSQFFIIFWCSVHVKKTITYFDNKFHCLYGDGACDSVKMVVDFLSVAGEIQIQLD